MYDVSNLFPNRYLILELDIPDTEGIINNNRISLIMMYINKILNRSLIKTRILLISEIYSKRKKDDATDNIKRILLKNDTRKKSSGKDIFEARYPDIATEKQNIPRKIFMILYFVFKKKLTRFTRYITRRLTHRYFKGFAFSPNERTIP